MRHPPIAVMSFNRPDYLRQVLSSLAAQEGAAIGEREVFLFQDNWRNAHSGRICAEPEEIEACIAVFREIFPAGHVMASPHNIGVAENFFRAETHAFREIGADCGYFFEDDLVLAPHYLATLDRLRDLCGEGGQVGYFACYGNLQASEADQRRNARVLRRLGHLWGFGLFRQHWEEMQPVMADYYGMVLGRDYRGRPSAEILRRYRERGIDVGVSSQDDVKKAVTYHLGRVALNTNLVNARYIGAVGLHMNAAKFEAAGFTRTLLLGHADAIFDLPDAARMEALRQEEAAARQRAIEKEAAAQAAREAAKAEAKAARIAARKAAAASGQAAPAPPSAEAPMAEATPAEVAPAEVAPAGAPMAGAAPADNPAVEQGTEETAADPGRAKLGPPRMAPAELALFQSVLGSGRRRYAEFGLGGSTLLAVRQGFEAVVGVESDRAWLASLLRNEEVAAEVAAGRCELLHGNIGPTGAWGAPADRQQVKPWPRYIATMWEAWDRRGSFPDLVFVDGRFRVACCIAVALLAAARGGCAPLVLLHEVTDRRPQYQRVFDFFHLEEQAGSLCVLSPRQRIPPERMLAALLGHVFDAG
jgi:hypothetical protein